MKVRLLIWAVTLAMVVGAVVLLARRERAASAADSGDTREDLFEFAGRMDERLAAFERQLPRPTASRRRSRPSWQIAAPCLIRCG
jgi:hypothetical protein